jgi:hypothetical protein
MKSHTQRRAGNAIIEAALTLGLFVTFLFSLFDFGWVLFIHQTIVSQARGASRYGAINPGDTTGIQNMAIYGQTTGSGSGIAGLTSSNVNVNRQGTAGASDDRIVVKVSGYRYHLVTPGWAGTFRGKDIVVSSPVENN